MFKTEKKLISNEVWKDIKGYEGLYQVSNLGRVKSLERDIEYIIYGKTKYKHYNEIILKPQYDKDGYEMVKLCKNGTHKRYFIHRLVAFAFIPNDDPINKFQVNHKDEVKTNNRVDNLEWCTNEYNFNYNDRNLLKKARRTRESKRINGILKNKNSKYIIQIDPKTNEVMGIYQSISDAANKNGYSRGAICTACKSNVISYKSIWKYCQTPEIVNIS